MRLYIALIFILLNSALVIGQEAEFFVKKPIHKFAKTKEGVLLEHSYIVSNTGKSPLIISDYKVECTCTKVFLPKEPILPGKSGLIKVTFDTNGKAFYQDRIIYLSTNSKRNSEKIRFKVYVDPK